tara:strand:- start:637 stop:912 length:276 start_codon:yes stop_codon:yes gene_type:complete
MPGSLGLGLNMGGVTSGGSGGSSSAAITGATFWNLVSAGNLEPIDEGTVTDYNLIWDLDGDNYMPQETPTSDGYWDAAYVSSEWEVSPKDV